MSGLHAHFWWRDVDTFHHASNFKTIVALQTAANRPIKIHGLYVSTNGTTAANAKPCWGLRLVTLGSASPGGDGFLNQAANYDDSANLGGLRKTDLARSETFQTLITRGPSAAAAWSTDFTADTSGSDWIIGPRYLHEQNDWQWANTLPIPILIPAASYVALQVRNNNAAGVLSAGWIDFEE